jgi:hypothetical protein
MIFHFSNDMTKNAIDFVDEISIENFISILENFTYDSSSQIGLKVKL